MLLTVVIKNVLEKKIDVAFMEIKIASNWKIENVSAAVFLHHLY